MSIYDSEILSYLREVGYDHLVSVENDPTEFVRGIEEAFPFLNGRPDWEHMAVHLTGDGGADASSVSAFVRSIFERFMIDGTVVYVGDSLTDYSYEFSVLQSERILPAFLEIPQHHYLVHKKYYWIFVVSFEGDVDFGAKVELLRRK